MIALLLLVPMQLLVARSAKGLPGFTARDVAGSVWSARLRGVAWASLSVDEVGVRLRPFPLLYGQQHWAIDSEPLKATLLRGRLHGLRNANGTLGLDLPKSRSRLDLILQDVAVVFQDGRCKEGAGRILVDWSFPRPAAATTTEIGVVRLEGEPRCADSKAAAVLSPSTALPPGVDSLNAQLQITAQGQYRIDTVVETQQPALQLGLQVAGFEMGPDGLRQSEAGQVPP